MIRTALNGIWHYRRVSLVMAIAVAIATTVVGGALVVGDSIRYSLRQMTELRLGKITDVLASPLFIREELTDDLAESSADAQLAPALLMTGAVEFSGENETIRRAGSVSVIGVTNAGWGFLDHGDVASPEDREIHLGYRTASQLGIDVGEDVSVWLELPSTIPRDSLLGEREDVTIEMVLTVAAIIPEETGASRFDLQPGQQLPFNAFVDLRTLQERLDLEAIEISRRNPQARAARINTILVATEQPTQSSGEARAFSDAFNKSLVNELTTEDLDLRFRVAGERGYISAETDRMILSDAIADGVEAAAADLGLEASPTVVYLSNEIFAEDRASSEERYSMYSILAGVDFNAPAPLGGSRLENGEAVSKLADNEIVISRWLADDLDVSVGDEVGTLWHDVGSHGELPEIRSRFVVAGILTKDDEATVDRNLTPYVKGVTDVESFSDVDQPFEMDMNRLTDRDDLYWEEHRATPKAFVSLAAAESLWESRYGTFTSIRLAPSSGGKTPGEKQMADIVSRLQFEVPRRIDASAIGISFRPIRQQGLDAAVGANDFSQLFIGFSFFLIVSAIILAALMFSLGLQQRLRQFGLLNAVGWPEQMVRRLFVTEGSLIAAVGVVGGVAGAVGFGHLMLKALKTLWIGAVGTTHLQLDVRPEKLVIAALGILLVVIIVLRRSLRSFQGLEVRQQLSGAFDSATESKASRGSRKLFAPVCLLIACLLPILVMKKVVPEGEAFGGMTWSMVCFFLAGFSCLIGGLGLLNSRLRKRSAGDLVKSGRLSLRSLAVANAARNPSRSRMSTALIAFATFVIVAVGAGRRNPLTEVPDRTSGNGGFSLVAESSQAILFDMNTADGQTRLNLANDSIPEGTTVYPFSVRPGSDASCVNLYQTRIPRILGADALLIDRGGFRFADTRGENPWQLLAKEAESQDGLPVIPVIGDNNTLTYSLKKGIGSRIPVPDQNTPQFYLEVVGKLDGSVFQGVLLTSDEHLKRVAPEVAGARYFLVDCDPSKAPAVSDLLETALSSYGMDVESVNDRIAGFLAVQNTYLSTFQLLGGLGLLVGTFGLAVVMLRNVMERGAEIALMRAVGFSGLRIARLVLRENMTLLLWGMILGASAAIIAMLPHLRSTGGDLPWKTLTATLGVVLSAGIVASLLAVRAAMKTPIRENLAAA